MEIKSPIGTTQQLIKKYSQRTDLALQTFLNQFPADRSPLLDAMKYSVLSGGKRIRPFLIYSVGEMLQGDLNRLDIAAAAIECIHAYSLIHDDLPAMDNAALRRGQPTSHMKYGEAQAILAGDALQAMAYDMLSHAEIMPPLMRVKIMQELSRSSGVIGMCGGQADDLLAENCRLTLEELQQVHIKKTGMLIRSAVRIGAHIANRYAILPVLDRYATAIGLAFQIQDDILDLIGNEASTGKDHGSDAINQKNTFPALLGLEGAQEKANELYTIAINALKELKGYNTEVLMDLTHYIIHRQQ